MPTSTSCSGLSCLEEAPSAFERKVYNPGEAVDGWYGVFFIDTHTGRAEGYRLPATYNTGPGDHYNTGLGGHWVVAEAEEATYLLNRETGRAWQWPSAELEVVAFSADRLLIAERNASRAHEHFYILNATMDEQARFVIEFGDRWWNWRKPGFFSPDGRAVAFLWRGDSGDRVYVVDVETGQPTRVVQPAPPEGYFGYVSQLRPLSEGRGLHVVASYYRPGVLSRAIEETWSVTWEGAGSEPLCEGRLSPDGRYTAWMEGRAATAKYLDQVGPEEPVPSVVIADAGTCEPILRVRYAILLDHGWAGQWLPTSEGLVIRVEGGFAVMRPHTTPALSPLPVPPSAPPHSWGPLPAPGVGSGVFLYDLAGIYDDGADRWVHFPVFDALSLGDGVSKWGAVRWGSSTREIQFIQTDYLGEADITWNLQPPQIELLVPVLVVVSDGAPDALNLEWTGGPADATGWQYRTRGPWYSDRAAWGEWTDIPGGGVETRRYRLGGLHEETSYGVQVRAIVGTVAGEPSGDVWNTTPTLDANGVPRLYELAEGGRAWRVGATVVDIPAGMRAFATAYPLGDPSLPYEEGVIVDAESGSELGLATDFGAECWRHLSPAAPGRDVGALFDQIVASARVQLDAEPDLSATTPGDRGIVTLRWVGGADDATRWEYRLRGPYSIGGGGPELPWGGWTEVPGSDGDTDSHSVSGRPEGTAWGFQVRAVADGVAGVPSLEVLGAPAVVGADGIPQLHGYVHGYGQRAEGGRTWRLHDSATVIDVPGGLVVSASPPGYYSDGRIAVSEQSTGDWTLVDVEAAEEVGFEGGIVATVPPCGVWPAGHAQLFDQMRASLRLQPVVQ